MPHALKVYLCVLPVIFALDYLWIGVLASGLYRNELGDLLRGGAGGLKPVIWAAMAVYLALPAGIVLFVLPRVAAGAYVLSSIGWGAAFGLVVYAVYDFTNYSLLSGWPLRVTLIDIAWGAVLNGAATLAAATLDRWFR